MSVKQVRLSRYRRERWTVILVSGLLLGAALLLLVLPWAMGLTAPVQHVYVDRVPLENRGVYVVTRQGVMQLYNWYFGMSELPADAPALRAQDVHYIAVVQKQFGPVEEYQLIRLGDDAQVRWRAAEQHERELALEPGPLPPGDYLLIRQTDGMYGGKTYHYFRIR